LEYFDRTTPAVTYDFIEVKRLERYFAGEITAAQLAPYVTVEYQNPAARQPDPLAQLRDVEPKRVETKIADPLPETFSLGRVWNDYKAAGREAADIDWARAGAYSASAVLASSLLDRRAFTFAENHKDNRLIKAGVTFGNALPWLGLAGSAVAAVASDDPHLSRTGYAAAEAGMAALMLGTGVKYLVGRGRPEAGLGPHSFQYFSSDNAHNSFPSRHTLTAWAVATPFALEYSANWLYGAAALTNLARIGSREHWVSDTVASSLIGYGLGRIFWQSGRDQGEEGLRVIVQPNGVAASWSFK
jgi:membrane-associated phospholipid phosphatase